jgi:hypothetical protein
MKLQYIRLKEVLSEMDRMDPQGKPVSFDIRFVTADRKRGTSGEIIEIKDARKCIDIRDGEVVYDQRKAASSGDAAVSRPPNHWINGSRNLLLPNGGIRKIHIRLIIEFNGKKVCF